MNDVPKQPVPPPPDATRPRPAPSPAEQKAAAEAYVETRRAKMVATAEAKKPGPPGAGSAVGAPKLTADGTAGKPKDATVGVGAVAGTKPGDRYGYPAGPTKLAADLEASRVVQLQRGLEKQGYSPEKIAGLRQDLRDNPDLCARLGKNVQDTALWRDFAHAGQVPWERYRTPGAEVDGLLHKGLGRGAGEYVSQKDLDDLAKGFGSGQRTLQDRGLASRDVEAVGRYLRDTGRSLQDDLQPEQVHMTSDGRQMPASDVVQHERERWIAAARSAPVTVEVTRRAGGTIDTAEHAAGAAKNVEDLAGAVAPTVMARADRAKAAGTPKEVRGPVRGESTERPKDSAARAAATDIPKPAAEPKTTKVRDGGVVLGGSKPAPKDAGTAGRPNDGATKGTSKDGATKGTPNDAGGGPAARGPETKWISGYDTKTMGRGGVEKITKYDPDVFGARTVEITGRLLEPVKNRDLNAPNYNRDQVWKDLRDELGLKGYQAAHLWGPGFGDEAAAGIMLAPEKVNQIWQNKGAEAFLRRLGDQAREVGGHVEVTAKATSHGRDVRGGDALLAQVSYEFKVVDRNGQQVGTTTKAGFSVGPPPHGRVHDVQLGAQ